MIGTIRWTQGPLRIPGSTFFYYKVDQALAQIAQRDCRDSLFGHIQKPSGHSSEQSVLDDRT